jgi:hypothetical protein
MINYFTLKKLKMFAMLHCDARDDFCGRCRNWAAFIALGHWSLAVHLFAVPSNLLSTRKRVNASTIH